MVLLLLPKLGAKDPEQFKGLSRLQVIQRFDPLGSLVLLPTTITLLLALQWGGQKYAWSDGRIIGLLVCAGVCAVVFIVIQHFQGEYATVPKDLITRRSVICAVIYTFCGSMAFMTVVFYLPIW